MLYVIPASTGVIDVPVDMALTVSDLVIGALVVIPEFGSRVVFVALMTGVAVGTNPVPDTTTVCAACGAREDGADDSASLFIIGRFDC